jgi:hypothetical protein
LQSIPEPSLCVKIAQSAKAAGNARFKEGEYGLALHKYAKAGRYVSHLNWLGVWGHAAHLAPKTCSLVFSQKAGKAPSFL